MCEQWIVFLRELRTRLELVIRELNHCEGLS